MELAIERLRFAEDGLLPVVAQDVATGRVLMLAFANREAVGRTLATGEAHFWSRSRGELWRKGATSGNVLEVERVAVDCDGDALLFLVRPRGPACHTGRESCFDDGEPNPAGDRLDLAALERIVSERAAGDPARSYTARLLHEGLSRAAQKVGEEATEVVVAALTRKSGDGTSEEAAASELVNESADLLFHLAVLLRACGVGVAEVERELARRHRAANR